MLKPMSLSEYLCASYSTSAIDSWHKIIANPSHWKTNAFSSSSTSSWIEVRSLKPELWWRTQPWRPDLTQLDISLADGVSVMWIGAVFLAIVQVIHFRSITLRQQSRGRGKGCILLWVIVAWWLCTAGLTREVKYLSETTWKKKKKNSTSHHIDSFPAVLWKLNAQLCWSAGCCH